MSRFFCFRFLKSCNLWVSDQAQQLLFKQENAIIKLQAAVRGHIVRRHAVGTLRCIQAIVKMQALVRKRQICLLNEGSGGVETEASTANPMLLVTLCLLLMSICFCMSLGNDYK